MIALHLFEKEAFTSASFADAVNHFAALGEDAAVQQLHGMVSDAGTQIMRIVRFELRVAFVCRVLFEPRFENLRPPAIGQFSLPRQSMPAESWPLYPVALSGSSYFVLTEGFFCAGVPEEPREYIIYCRENGVFRKTPVSVPTRNQALSDAATLRKSAA
jgi:hypothetical protein